MAVNGSNNPQQAAVARVIPVVEVLVNNQKVIYDIDTAESLRAALEQALQTFAKAQSMQTIIDPIKDQTEVVD